jgi:SynChlorMet cassette radical SAM/SPASM protein ScmF
MMPVMNESSGDNPPVYRLYGIYFYLTEGCNLRCRHCWLSAKYQAGGREYAYLPVDTFDAIIREAKPLGLRSVKLTGGEPLLNPGIRDMLRTVRDEGMSLSVETNGVLCTREIAADIASCRGHHVSVSLDGVDAGTHEWVRGIPGCFDRAIEGIKNLVAAGVRPQIIMTIMRKNMGQMDDMTRLAGSLGAGSVKFNLLQPVARGKALQMSGESLGIDELVGLGRKMSGRARSTDRIPVYYSQPLAFVPLGNMFNDKGSCTGVCGIKGIIGVLSDGAYALCGIGNHMPELVFGHAGTDGLKEIWKDSPMINMLREGLPHKLEGVCGECVFRNKCMGNCIAQSYYRNKSLWSPYWYCEEADKAGLFPETRRWRMRT